MPILNNYLQTTSLIHPLYKIDFSDEPSLFLPFFSKLLEGFFTKEWIEALTRASPEVANSHLIDLEKELPLITWEINPHRVKATVLASALYTQGLGRYFCDALSHWLNPGKFLNISQTHCLDFYFTAAPNHSFFIAHIVVDLSDDEESIAKMHIHKLVNDIRITVLSVRHVRQLIRNKQLSNEERILILQDNVSSLLNRQAKNFDINLHDEMHQLLLKLAAEKNREQLHDKIKKAVEKKPNIYSRDLFHELQHFILLFRERFTATHDIKTLARIIACHFFFQKRLENQVKQDPNHRYLHLKIYKLAPQHLSILVGINTLNENELFSKRHLVEAIRSSLPLASIIDVPDSFIADYREQGKIRLFYLEIKEQSDRIFQYEEIKNLKHYLPGELISRCEQMLHPVFMPRNEEEIIRTIILLNRQLKYPNDLPQGLISFETQSNLELSFIFILVRVCKGPSLKELMEANTTHIKIGAWEIKELGYMRNQWKKEAHILQLSVEKSLFLCKDYKVDLLEARHYITSKLEELVGKFRDYNGGILSKQHETFLDLQNHSPSLSSRQDLLFRECFFSLSPPLMRSILPTDLLHSFLHLFLELSEAKEKTTLYKETPHFLLTATTTLSAHARDTMYTNVQELPIPSSDLTFSSFLFEGIYFLGFIVRSEEQKARSSFLNALKL